MDNGKKLSSLSLYGGLIVALIATVLALLVRGYQLESIQYVYDEWLAMGPGSSISLNDGLGTVIWQIHSNVYYYISSAVTITHSVLMQIIKLFIGLDPVAIRWLYAIIASLGVGMTALIAARLYRPWSVATWSVILLGVFSTPGIIVGQFICHYAFFYLLTATQVALYLLYLRRSWAWYAFVIFVFLAYAAQLLSYLQLYVTAGIFLAALVEITWRSRRFRHYLTWLIGIILYAGISFMHFFATFLLIPRSEIYRWYMAPYYPLALLGRGAPVTSLDNSWFGYFLVRLYDLINYHWAAVFNPGIYQPLRWNWVSLPFLLIFAGVLGIGVINQAAALKQKRTSGKGTSNQSSDSKIYSPRTSLLIVIISVTIIYLVANRLLLLPLGGIRQSAFLAPLLWLAYGGMARQILLFFRTGKKSLSRLFALVLITLPVLPFALSFPHLYQNRVNRIDLDKLIEAITHYHPEKILSSQQSIQQLELAMIVDPRFEGINWPGYLHEVNVLEADLVVDRPFLKFTLLGRPYAVELTGPENFPKEATNLLYLDMFVSHDARFEGPKLLRFYQPLDRLVSDRQKIIPLMEKPGNAPNAIHQSIYWPPNAFYLYRIVSRSDHS